jgi:hypothetical protein
VRLAAIGNHFLQGEAVLHPNQDFLQPWTPKQTGLP